MSLPRCTTIFLILALASCPSARGSQAVEPRAKTTPVAAVDLTVHVVVSPPLSRQDPVSPSSPSRLRRKAVLEETQTPVADNSDLGRVPSPSPFLAVLPTAPMPCLFFGSLPLRC
jgi:hypothetical protein